MTDSPCPGARQTVSRADVESAARHPQATAAWPSPHFDQGHNRQNRLKFTHELNAPFGRTKASPMAVADGGAADPPARRPRKAGGERKLPRKRSSLVPHDVQLSRRRSRANARPFFRRTCPVLERRRGSVDPPSRATHARYANQFLSYLVTFEVVASMASILARRSRSSEISRSFCSRSCEISQSFSCTTWCSP